eukprot:TRINITY_DN11299_c1_g1_i4.p1 TRINITY_DN11299_c1_g1~~TRINITY_DN11299_c1_g1_i4.p1  ORF type:complete len:538 (+),score=48.08 TRINITY_DN11299_c1_g1_i4:77-1615(+)
MLLSKAFKLLVFKYVVFVQGEVILSSICGGTSAAIGAQDISLGPDRCVYFVNQKKSYVGRCCPSGAQTFEVYAGSSGEAALVNGNLREARFSNPLGLTWCDGDLFVADNKCVVRKITQQGMVSTFLGDKDACHKSKDGSEPSLVQVSSLWCNNSNQLIIMDQGASTVYEVDLGPTNNNNQSNTDNNSSHCQNKTITCPTQECNSWVVKSGEYWWLPTILGIAVVCLVTLLGYRQKCGLFWKPAEEPRNQYVQQLNCATLIKMMLKIAYLMLWKKINDLLFKINKSEKKYAKIIKILIYFVYQIYRYLIFLYYNYKQIITAFNLLYQYWEYNQNNQNQYKNLVEIEEIQEDNQNNYKNNNQQFVERQKNLLAGIFENVELNILNINLNKEQNLIDFDENEPEQKISQDNQFKDNQNYSNQQNKYKNNKQNQKCIQNKKVDFLLGDLNQQKNQQNLIEFDTDQNIQYQPLDNQDNFNQINFADQNLVDSHDNIKNINQDQKNQYKNNFNDLLQF